MPKYSTIKKAKQRNRRRAAGLCIDCGRPARPNSSRCEDCLYLKAAKQRITNMRKKAGRWNGAIMAEPDRQKIALGVFCQWLKEGFITL